MFRDEEDEKKFADTWFMPGVTEEEVERQPILRQCFMWKGATGKAKLAMVLKDAIAEVQGALAHDTIDHGYPFLAVLERISRTPTGGEVMQISQLLFLMAFYPTVRRNVLARNTFRDRVTGRVEPDATLNAFITDCVAIETNSGLVWWVIHGSTAEEAGFKHVAPPRGSIMSIVYRFVPPAPDTWRGVARFIKAVEPLEGPTSTPASVPEDGDWSLDSIVRLVSGIMSTDVLKALLAAQDPERIAVDVNRLPHINSDTLIHVRNHEAPRIQTLPDLVNVFLNVMYATLPDAYVKF